VDSPAPYVVAQALISKLKLKVKLRLTTLIEGSYE